MDKNLRQERMVSVVHAAAAEFFVECGRDWDIGVLPLVEQVFVSPDLHNVEIWVSFSPWKKDRAEGDFEVIEKHLGELKKWLGKKIALRRFPEVKLKLADPEKTFHILDILGTISGHGESGPTNQGENSASKEDSADGSH